MESTYKDMCVCVSFSVLIIVVGSEFLFLSLFPRKKRIKEWKQISSSSSKSLSLSFFSELWSPKKYSRVSTVCTMCVCLQHIVHNIACMNMCVHRGTDVFSHFTQKWEWERGAHFKFRSLIIIKLPLLVFLFHKNEKSQTTYRAE